MRRLILLTLWCWLWLPLPAGWGQQSAQVTLVWNEPFLQVDGAPLTDLGTYRVYRSPVPIPDTKQGAVIHATLTAPVAAPQPGDITAYGITLPLGVHYVRVSAVDKSGNESALSNQQQIAVISAGSFTVFVAQ